MSRMGRYVFQLQEAGDEGSRGYRDEPCTRHDMVRVDMFDGRERPTVNDWNEYVRGLFHGEHEGRHRDHRP